LERVRTVLREVKQRARELDPTALDDPDVQCDVARVSALAREFIQRYPSLFAESNAALDRIIAEARAAATSRKESRQ